MTRVIYLPGIDRAIALGDYVKAVKTAKAHPDLVYRAGLNCWWPCTGAEIVQQFRAGLTDRINQSVPYHLRGRSFNASRTLKAG